MSQLLSVVFETMPIPFVVFLATLDMLVLMIVSCTSACNCKLRGQNHPCLIYQPGPFFKRTLHTTPLLMCKWSTEDETKLFVD